MIGNILDYMHYEIDLDGAKYLFTNKDVKDFWNENPTIKAIIDKYKNETEQGLYIIGNRLFFTLNGLKYEKLLTNSDIEWDTIGKLIKQLEPYCSNIAYYPGRLD